MRAGIRNENDLRISGRIGGCSSNEQMIKRQLLSYLTLVSFVPFDAFDELGALAVKIP